MVGFCAIVYIVYLALPHPPALQGSEQVTVELGDLVHVRISVPTCLLMCFVPQNSYCFLGGCILHKTKSNLCFRKVTSVLQASPVCIWINKHKED